MKALLFRANNIFASRCSKYVNFYKRVNVDFIAVGWDRSLNGIEKECYDFYRYPAGVAEGGTKAMLNHIHWMIFVYNYLKKHNDIDFVHACDLNCAFPVALYRTIHRRNDIRLIFDVCDWFSANFGKYRILKRLLFFMEQYTTSHSSKIIICEPERINQIQCKLKDAPLVLPNIPEIDESKIACDDEKYCFDNDWPTFAYFGGFTDDRFLLELIKASETEKINVLIGGYGVSAVEEACKRMNGSPNFKYFGKMSMEDGLSMSRHADIVYAMYCKINSNHIYAAPNKYYEAMFLGKAILSTKGIILEKKILNNNIGYVIEERFEDLIDFIRHFNRNDCQEKGRNSKMLWDRVYATYVKSFFDNEYSSAIGINS